MGLTSRDAAFATELVSGVARSLGTLDAIVASAAGRPLNTLQPAVIDALRLGAYQALRMRVPSPAAVGTTVDLAASQIGERVAGVVNAVMRRVVARQWDDWLNHLSTGLDDLDALALRTAHPRWIVDAFADLLPNDELAAVLEADNTPPQPTLAVRPELLQRDELVDATGGAPTRYSPWGVVVAGDPGNVHAIADGRAGVQDEGSQLVVLAAWRAAQSVPTSGPWLDLCAGPGGKTALLRGLAQGGVPPVGKAGLHVGGVRPHRAIWTPQVDATGCDGVFLVAADAQPHRAKLVAQALRGFDGAGHQVIVADGTRPAWCGGELGFVLADVPCSGLGALRRRPEARWRRQPADLDALTSLQAGLLDSALTSVSPGGLVAYVTCSPHRQETADIVLSSAARHNAAILDAPSWLPEVPQCTAATDARFVQLWPHRHGTDAMFLALLRRTQ